MSQSPQKYYKILYFLLYFHCNFYNNLEIPHQVKEESLIQNLNFETNHQEEENYHLQKYDHIFIKIYNRQNV